MATARELFDAAFTPDSTRTPRSNAYKAGVLAVLRRRVDRGPKGLDVAPYRRGSAEADAYWAGCAEGHQIADQLGAPLRGPTWRAAS